MSRMAKKDIKNRNHIVYLRNNNKVSTTKCNYVSVAKHWSNYCIEYDESPDPDPKIGFDYELVMFWMSERALMLGGCASLCTWQSTLGWLCDIWKAPHSWKSVRDYQQFKKDLKLEYLEESDSRLPFELDHLIRYTIHLKCYGKYLDTISDDNLLRVLLAQLYSCIMARPSEGLPGKKSKVKFGLTWSDIKHIKHTNDPLNHYYKLTIYGFKNRKYKKSVKTVWLGNSKYGHTYMYNSNKLCPCKFINPYKLLRKYYIVN